MRAFDRVLSVILISAGAFWLPATFAQERGHSRPPTPEEMQIAYRILDLENLGGNATREQVTAAWKARIKKVYSGIDDANQAPAKTINGAYQTIKQGRSVGVEWKPISPFRPFRQSRYRPAPDLKEERDRAKNLGAFSDKVMEFVKGDTVRDGGLGLNTRRGMDWIFNNRPTLDREQWFINYFVNFRILVKWALQPEAEGGLGLNVEDSKKRADELARKASGLDETNRYISAQQKIIKQNFYTANACRVDLGF